MEQCKICLSGASSSLGLIPRQGFETSTLGNWTPLRSSPIPFKGGLLYDGEILQPVDWCDKKEYQLKKARAFRGRSRAGSTSQTPALRPARPRHLLGVVKGAIRDPVFATIFRGRGRSQSGSRRGVSFKELPSARHCTAASLLHARAASSGGGGWGGSSKPSHQRPSRSPTR